MKGCNEMKKITLSDYYDEYEDQFFMEEKEGILVFTRKGDNLSEEIVERLNLLNNEVDIEMLEIDADEAAELMDKDALDISGVPGVALFMENMRYQEYNCSNEYDFRGLIRDLKEWF